MINLDIRQFHNTIITYINSNNIPIEIKYLVIKDIYNQLEVEANKQIYLEQQENERNEENNKEVVDVDNKLS